MIITEKTELVNNLLSEIRSNGIMTNEIVETIQEIFPQHNKKLLQKCERSNEYGVELRKEAVELLRSRFGKLKRKDTHKLQKKLFCRVGEDVHAGFQIFCSVHARTTVNNMLYSLVLRELAGCNDTSAAIIAQQQYCSRHNVPLFIPTDGMCFRCGKNIFGRGGLTVYSATTGQITVCPYCRRSFDD